MIYIHGGWPKTGTTSLQAAIARNRDRLAGFGTVYPDRWIVGNSHNGLARMLHTEAGVEAASGELRRFLEAEAGRDVLLSSESLFFFLREEETQAALLRLLGAAQEVGPVRVVWTLRRVDEMVGSLYRQLRATNRGRIELKPPEELAVDFDPEPTLAGCRRVEELVADVAYVKYDRLGDHSAELLRAFGLPAEAIDGVRRDLVAAPRLNTALSQRTAAAARERDGERLWEAADEAASRRLHERTLQVSRRRGFEPYLRFFGAGA